MHAGCIENIKSQCECVQYTYNVILIAYEAHLKVSGQTFMQQSFDTQTIAVKPFKQ